MLCFTATAHIDYYTSKQSSVFEVLTLFSKKSIRSDVSLSSVIIFKKCLSGYSTMFLPIVVAFPFMISFCAERNNGLMRFTITRTGALKYYLSKFLASSIGGGLAVTGGAALFGIMCMILFPPMSSYNVIGEELKWLLPDGALLTVVKVLCGAFLYGVISTLPAFFLSSFCKNPYLITCLPFPSNYLINAFLDKLSSDAFRSGNFELSEKLSSFYPTASIGLFFYRELNGTALKILIVSLSYVIIAFAGFAIIMSKHTDKGA